MKRICNRTTGLSLAAIATATLTQGAFAQEAPNSSVSADKPAAVKPTDGFAEIIVTARKTGENQQALPISISAFSGEQLGAQAVQSVQDFQTITPGLNISTNQQGGSPIFAIRGVATENGIDGGVAVYLDDAPLISTMGVVNAFYDISTVEILKGPQGTQFGTNTTGGTISVRANKPTDEFEAYVKGGYGNFNRREVEGMINIPVNDVLKFRFAGNLVKRDGWLANPSAGPGQPSEFGNLDYHSFRASMRMEGSGVTSDLVFDYFKKDENGLPASPVLFTDNAATAVYGVGTNPALFGAELGDNRTIHIGSNAAGTVKPLFVRAELYGLQHQLNAFITDSLSIRNVAGFRHDNVATSEDNDGTSVALIDVLTKQLNDRIFDDLTLRYVNGNGRLRINLGTFYLRDKRIQYGVANAAQATFLALTGYPLTANIRFNGRRKFESKSVYGNVDFDVTDKITVFAGARYNWDSGSLVFSQSIGTGLPDTGSDVSPSAAVPCSAVSLEGFSSIDMATCQGRNTGKWRQPSWNAGINFKASDDILLYVKASHGYLAGGFNTTVRELPVFAPEKSTMYEGGIKADWYIANRPLRTNIALYYGKISNKQVFVNYNYDDGGSAAGVLNAAKETVYGMDAELTFSPFHGLTLNANYSYLHAKFDDFTIPEVGGPVYTTVPETDLSGNTPARSPKHQLTLSGSYKLPLPPSLGDISATFTEYYTSSIVSSNIDNTLTYGSQYNQIDAYWLANASLNWENIGGSPISAMFWMKNVFDKVYKVNVNAQFAAFGYATALYGEPRTYGVTASVKF